MKYIAFILLSCFAFAQNNGIRSLNGSLNNSQRLTVDTSSSVSQFKWTLSNGIHTLNIPYRIANLSAGGAVGDADSLGSVPATGYVTVAGTQTITGPKTVTQPINYYNGTNSSFLSGFPSANADQIFYLPNPSQNDSIWTLLYGEDTTRFRSRSDSLYGRKASTNIWSGTNYFTNRDYHTSIAVDTIDDNGTINHLRLTPSSPYSILAGASMTKASVNYVNMFGALQHFMRQTVGGFAYANSADTVFMGHATLSVGVPFVSYFQQNISGGLAGLLMRSDNTDTSSWYMHSTIGSNAGGAGTSTTSFQIVKFKGAGSSGNFERYDGSRYYIPFRVDTSNNVRLQLGGTAEFTQGNTFVDAGYFQVSNGYGDFDSLKFNGTTIGTKLAYHSGLGTSYWGTMNVGSLTSVTPIVLGSLDTTGATGLRSKYVPYSGANASVNLGAQTFTTTGAGSFGALSGTTGTLSGDLTLQGSRSIKNNVNDGYISIFADSLNGTKSAGFTLSGGRNTNEGQVDVLFGTRDSTLAQQDTEFRVRFNNGGTATVYSILDQSGTQTFGATARVGSGAVYADTFAIGSTVALDASRNATLGTIISTGASTIDTVKTTNLKMLSTGTKPVVGTASLVAGTVTVSTTAIKANSIVFMTNKTNGGTPSMDRTYTITAGTSFTVTSANILDTSTFGWMIVTPY